MIFGMVYWLTPRIFQTKLWSEKAASLHFWIAFVGIIFYIVPIYVAGFAQGMMWRGLDDNGNLLYPEFVETISSIAYLWWIRVFGGLLYVAGIGIMVVNYVQTWLSRPATYEKPIYEAARLSPTPPADPTPPTSKLEDAPVLGAARKIDSWNQMQWHRRWERLPVRFTVLTTIAVVVASLFEIIPTFLIRSNVPTISTVKPYTPLELAGRDLYVAEGCYNCHSQMIRPMVSEKLRYGDYSKPGEFIYDRPFQWGSRRIGPDLAREGGKNSSFWHWDHLENPQRVNEDSVMPSYRHLLTERINFEMIPDRVRSAHLLGAPYDRELTEAPEMAREQAERIAADIVSQGGPVFAEGELLTMDTKAVALIAYLQRLGTDLFATPETPQTDAENSEAASDASASPEDQAEAAAEKGDH